MYIWMYYVSMYVKAVFIEWIVTTLSTYRVFIKYCAFPNILEYILNFRPVGAYTSLYTKFSLVSEFDRKVSDRAD